MLQCMVRQKPWVCRAPRRDLGDETQIELHMDAPAALALINREGLGKARHIETQWLWIQYAARIKKVILRKHHGEKNPAGLMTKGLSKDKIDTCMGNMGYTFAQ